MRSKPYAEKESSGAIAQTAPRPWRPFRIAYCLSGLEILLAIAVDAAASFLVPGGQQAQPSGGQAAMPIPLLIGVFAPVTAVLLIAMKRYRRSRPEGMVVRDIFSCAIWSVLGQVAASGTYIILHDIVGAVASVIIHPGGRHRGLNEGLGLYTAFDGITVFVSAAISLLPSLAGAWVGRFATGASSANAPGRPRFGAAALGSAAAVGSVVAASILGYGYPFKTPPLPLALFLVICVVVLLGCCWACAAGMLVCLLRSRSGADGGRLFPLWALAALVVLALLACATLAYAIAIGPAIG